MSLIFTVQLELPSEEAAAVTSDPGTLISVSEDKARRLGGGFDVT